MERKKFGISIVLLFTIFLSCASSEEFTAKSGGLSLPIPLVLPQVTASDANASGRAITTSIETATEMMMGSDPESALGDLNPQTGVKSGSAPESIQSLFMSNNSGDSGSAITQGNNLSIRGIVFNDTTGEGIRTENKTGLIGWTLILRSEGNEDLQTITDDSGRYAFRNLIPGKYILFQVKPYGWNQTYPGGGNYSINLVDKDAYNYDFGNHFGPIPAIKREYPLMSYETTIREAQEYAELPTAYIDQDIKTKLKTERDDASNIVSDTASFSLLDYLTYTPSERDQGGCGNCWIWASTGCAEIDLAVQEGIRDRLSIQYITSKYNNGGSGTESACCGGSASTFAKFYSTEGMAIPWSNSNAQWQDGSRSCGGSTNILWTDISTNPNYKLTSIMATKITTSGQGQTTAIENIKNILLQNKPVYFSFSYPTSAAWDSFQTFWDTQPEAAIWNPDIACGQSFGTGGASHAVLCVGWDETTDPSNPCWIMINSWGANSNRPNCIFRVKMNMNYDCNYPSGINAYNFYTFDINWENTQGWAKLGGYLTSKHCAVMDGQGRRHVFAIGGDNALWDNVDGSWICLGGYLTSAPYAAKDKNGRIHIVARGGDNALWDFVFDTVSWSGAWKGLGGVLSSMPTAAMEPTYGTWMKIVARGGDNSLWLCEFNVNDLSSYNWFGLGGYLNSWPFVIFDQNSRMHTFVAGGENALWDNRGVLSSGTYNHNWHYLGGIIQGAPFSSLEPGYTNYLATMVVGTDNCLWMADINVLSDPETCNWVNFGGGIASETFVSTDTSGRIHTFVRGGEGAMWENVFSSNPWNPSGARWIGHGGAIQWSPWALLYGVTYAYVEGEDDAIWRKVFTTSAPEPSATEAFGKVNRQVESTTLVEGATGASVA